MKNYSKLMLWLLVTILLFIIVVEKNLSKPLQTKAPITSISKKDNKPSPLIITSTAINTIKGKASISWSPFFVYFPVGSNINIVIHPNPPALLSDFKFETLVNYNNQRFAWIPQKNKQGEVWQESPLLPVHFSKPGNYAVQINVYDIKQKKVVQRSWLGQFFIGKAKIPKRDFLVRQILSHHPDFSLSNTLDFQSIAAELHLALFLMSQQFYHQGLSSLSIAELKTSLKKFTHSNLSFNNKHVLVLKTPDKQTLNYNQSQHIITNGAGISINLSLTYHPHIKNIFKQVASLIPPARNSAIVTYLIASNYRYSQVSNLIFSKSDQLTSAHAECSLMSHMLKILLSDFGYDMTVVNLSFGKEHQVLGAHTVAQLHVGENYFVLDPTTNNMFGPYNQSFLIIKKFIHKTPLPFIRDLDSLLTVAPVISAQTAA